MKTEIMLKCEKCDQCDYVTLIYISNLGKTGWNELLCPNCFAHKLMTEFMKENKKMKCQFRDCNNEVMKIFVSDSHVSFYHYCDKHRPANFWDIR